MRILDRYLLTSFLKDYLISFLVLVGLYVLLDLVFNFDELIEVQTHAGSTGATTGGASFLAVLYVVWDYYFYQIFLIFAQLSGVIPVVAAAFTLVRLARFNELSAVLAAGVPLLRLAAPIIFATIGLNVLLLVDQELVVPRLVPKLVRNHDEVMQSGSKSFRIEAMQDQQGALIFVSRYTPPGATSAAEMNELDVIYRDPDHTVTGHLSAERAVYDPASKKWLLTKGLEVKGLQANQRRTRERPIAEYASDVTPEEIALFRSGDFVDMLSTARINQLLERPQSYGTINLLRVKHARVTQWIMNLVVVLLGIGCILTREPGRIKTDGLKLLIVVGLGMATVFVCHQLAVHPPIAGAAWADRWPAIMAWVPIFLFAPMAIFLLDRLHVRKS